jgi:GMP reductase
MTKISEEVKLDFDDVLIKPKRSTIESRKEVDICRDFEGKYARNPLCCCPVIAANMDTTGTIAMSRSLMKFGCLTALHKFYTRDTLIPLFSNRLHEPVQQAFVTIGIGDEGLKLIEELNETQKWRDDYVRINIDVANGYTERFVEFIKKVREKFPWNWISAGNVCTPEMTEQLILSGADIVKVGIGPGSVCETRIKTGIGYGQLSAILECKDAAHGLGGLIIADGGCKNPGDVCKALGAGADFVMLGGMLSGVDECEGEWEYEEKYPWHLFPMQSDGICFGQPSTRVIEYTDKKTFLKFYGMSSEEAQKKYYGAVQDYRAAEGTCVRVKYKGPAENVIKDIQGGLRSCCAYVGARRLKDLDKCTSFIKVNRVK